MNVKKILTCVASAVALLGADLANAQTTPDNAAVSGRNNASSAAGAARAPSTPVTTPATNSAAPSAAGG